MQSSTIRGKVTFVPWLAALVLGASAHASLLVHELRHGDSGEPPTVVVIEAGDHERVAHHERVLRQRARRRARVRGARSPGTRPTPGFESFDAPSSLDDWIEQRASYSYTIDRQALDHVVPRALLTIDRDGLETLAATVGLTEPLRLHNIRRDTPLWTLGLRNGDRVIDLRTGGDAGIERVTLAIERRGRLVDLSYELI